MSAKTVKNLEALREAMKEVRVDAVIIPGTDAHQSEYVCNHWKIRDWVTGFTGSNGTAVVTMKEGKLWTDSRYFLQAGEQLKDSGFELMKEDIPGEPTIEEWLAENLEEGSVLAVDGNLFSLVKANQLENFCARQGMMFATDFSPFDRIWEDRPARPQGKLFIHEEKFAGESVASKLERLSKEIESRGADAMFISALDEIAWLLNIRCDDVECTPVAIAHAYISEEKKVLFVDEAKVGDEVRNFLKEYGVTVKAYDSVQAYLEKLSSHEVVLMDPNKVSDTLGNAMPCGKVFDASPILYLKAIKNETQINGVRTAMTRDGVALVRTFKWLEENVASGEITEMDVAKKAIEMRKLGDYYVTESFGMIAGYADHGAIVHYSATPETNATLKPENLLLCDTGAQYLDGTTDITRTWCLGTPTADEIHDYTLVLKGHIAIATQIFPIGTRGSQLDSLARQFMWKEHVTYYHGTGHGVGHFLSVHEGPQNIRLNENPATMEPGMITSDEPGIYRAGKHGIRIENLTLVVPALVDEEFGQFYKFETLTLCPYDSKLIDVDMLTDEELQWVNNYHATVRERLSPGLSDEERAWLENKTQKIERK